VDPDPSSGTVLITGAAGRIGRLLRQRLTARWRLRLCDIAPQEPPAPGENVEVLTAAMADDAALARAIDGVAAIVHLAGISVEGGWQDILATNVDGTRRLLELAQRAGVRRVVLASSAHAAGFRTRADARTDEDGRPVLPASSAPRPDTYYGVSKAAMEALGSLYADRFGIHVVAIRIGTLGRPATDRSQAIWISADDLARLVEAAITPAHQRGGFHVVWGTSANTRRWTSLAEARALGYRPADDAANEVSLEAADTDSAGAENTYLGGTWTQIALGQWLRPPPLGVGRPAAQLSQRSGQVAQPAGGTEHGGEPGGAAEHAGEQEHRQRHS
jgi:nucleoside-diphosphate-sugar epimerase